MQSHRDESPARRPAEPCLPVKISSRRHYQRRKPSSTSSSLCATLFFAYIFSPLSNHDMPRHLVHAFTTPLSSKTITSPRVGVTKVFSSTAEIITESATTTISTRQVLEKMTVKQLKSYIQEEGIQIPKGQASSLKLKKQIVDFIWNHQIDNGSGDSGGANDNDENDVHLNGSQNGDNANNANGKLKEEEVTESQEPASPTKKRKVNKFTAGTGMPPLPTTATPPSKTNSNDENSSPYVLTPKDRIVLDVLNRYPPLHQSIIDACVSHENGMLADFPLEGITTANIEHCDLTAINYAIPTTIGEDDVRHTYHPMLANSTQSDMDVVFIGTASCTPGMTRGVSCTALRLNWRSSRTLDDNDRSKQHDKSRGEKKKAKKGTYTEERGPTGGTWLFDAGESTQLSIQKTPSIKPGKISKVFITHCHGDHSFGLPGLLCLAGTDRSRDDPPVEIYGPEGLRMWLRVAIRYSVSRVVPPYRVHELMDVPMAPEWEEGHRRNGRFYFQLKRDMGARGNGRANNNGGSKGRRWGMKGLAGEDPSSWISRAPMINLEPNKDFGEIEGGQDIFPNYDHPSCSSDGAPVWEVIDDDDVMVHAAPMSHGVPCVGYVVTERDRPGRLKPENVMPIIERNRKGLVESGVRNPMKVMAMVKNLDVGGSYEFPDGTVVRQEDVVEPPRKGRKVVICGDTADCRALEGLGQDADVLVHEATNTFLKGIDKDGTLQGVTRDAKIHGHSTPYMAGEFAKRINAKKLVMNHFSARYKGDQSVESMTIMTRMERQAIKASGLDEESVAAAWDFMVLPVARN